MDQEQWEEMREPDSPEPQFELPAWIGTAPFEALCGIQIDEAGDGRAVLRMPFRVKLAQGKGLLHGGALTTLADTAVAMAIKSLVPENTHFGTVEAAIRFHGPVRRGWVEARAEVKRFEGRDIEGEALVYAGTEHVATFCSKFRVARKRPEQARGGEGHEPPV